MDFKIAKFLLLSQNLEILFAQSILVIEILQKHEF